MHISADKFRVLVTRPEHQADELCQMIEDHGWMPVRFPTIEIHALDAIELPSLQSYDGLIFTSRNAVELSFNYFHKTDIRHKALFAIGHATSNALKNRGLEPITISGDKASSEQLLALPELESEDIRQKSFLILTGAGGRDTLQRGLASRVKKVDRLALYERQIPCYDKPEVEKIWSELPNAVVITSCEAVDNLIDILKPTIYYNALFGIQTIALSNRIAEYIKNLGFTENCMVASSTSDKGLVDVLIHMFDEE